MSNRKVSNLPDGGAAQPTDIIYAVRNPGGTPQDVKISVSNLASSGGISARSGTAQSIYDMADTWNNLATTYTAIKMNVTDTQSGPSSKLMDLCVGGSTRFAVDKNGNGYAKGMYGIGGSAGAFNGFYLQSSSIHVYTNNGTLVNSFHTDGLHVDSAAFVGWVASGGPTSGYDIKLGRVASGILGILNGAGSAYQFLQAKLRTHANAVAEAISATHTLTLYDAAGTAYKVPAVAA